MAGEHVDPRQRRKLGPSGFRPASAALGDTLRTAAAKRGFAEHRLIARWEEVVGRELAAFTSPVRVTYGGRDGLGGTLILAVDGARAVEAAHLCDRIVERVNAIYGYRAVARVKVTQTGRREDVARPAGAPSRRRGAEPGAEAGSTLDAPISPNISAISHDGLRAALARLDANRKSRASRAPE